MNIFVVNSDPVLAAKDLCNKHVVKMSLETAQMLCYISYINNGFKRIEEPYAPCKPHLKHPCVLWANKSIDNWNWLYEHGIALFEEYTKRYKRKHKSMDVILWAKDFGTKPTGKGLTDFVQCMPEYCRSKDPIIGYRKFYVLEKSKFAVWKNCQPPQWYVDGLKNGLKDQ